MKRWMKDNSSGTKDAFDVEWEKKFGPDDETMKFDSLEEFHKWLEEVKNFDPVHNKYDLPRIQSAV